MTGRTRRTAVTAVAASLGLTGAVLLAAAPMVTANASSRVVTIANPDGPGAVEPDAPTVDVTQTVTVTAQPTETADPVVTMTMTITPQPTVTRTRTVRPSRPPATQPQPTPPAATPPAVLPTAGPVTTPDAGQAAVATPSPTESPLTLAPVESGTPDATAGNSTAFEEPTPESVPYEIRNASPEYDQIALSKQLAVPGILMVLLVVFAVFLFQGRLQRMAHAAAVRKAGPRPAGRLGGSATTYPATPAYAPIISFVPLQPYPMPTPQATYPGYTYPQATQPFAAGQAYPQGQAFQQAQPTQPDPGFGGYPQAGTPAASPMGAPQPGRPTGTQTGQAFPQQPYQTGQWPGAAQPWSGAPTTGATPAGTGPLSGPGAFPGASGPVPGDQGEGLGHQPSNAPSTPWYGPQAQPSPGPEQGMAHHPSETGPRHRDTGPHGDDDEATSLFFDAPPRRELEPGPPSIPGPPVETVSVERLGPDGEPMGGTRLLPVQDDPAGPYPSGPGGTLSYPAPHGTRPNPDEPGPEDKKRRPWRRFR